WVMVMKMKNYDVIVVGAGISGLLSGLALSKEGKRVLILEKESYVGGVCRSYPVDGYLVDTGPHAITRLESGPLRELMNRYFDLVPKFIPFGTYYVRVDERIKPFPWNIKDWFVFDLIPMKDRLLLMKSLFDTVYMLNTGKDLSNVSMSDIIPSDISITSKRFLDWLSYFMVGTSMENAPVSRFIDNKSHMPSSIPYGGRLYNLLITEGATDQGYPKRGLQSIVDSILCSFPQNRVEIKTNEEVLEIQDNEGISGVVTKEDSYDCSTVIYSGFASDLPNLIDDLPRKYVKNLKSVRKVNSLTIWLGLDKKIFKNHGSEMWINSEPSAWVVPTSNCDPRLAPKGKQLVGFAFILPEECNLEEMKKKALGVIFDTIPDIEGCTDMIHYQELIPEKASWSINSGFGDVETPVKNLYCVGTDAEKRSAGVSRAAYSVLRCLEIMKSDKVL
ncbi:MAG: NAD(P)/FAD-dependent oxidoreductase, partial [Methanophagales archaeon]|nr:NAD(P)/FAD-dependent oxidoreductase [Methanophagales archaeon]